MRKSLFRDLGHYASLEAASTVPIRYDVLQEAQKAQQMSVQKGFFILLEPGELARRTGRYNGNKKKIPSPEGRKIDGLTFRGAPKEWEGRS